MQQKENYCQFKLNKNKVLLNDSSVKFNFTTMNETFGEWLKNLREELKLSQQDLADRSGVTKATISLLETNKIAAPRFDGLERIAKALNISSETMRRNFAEKFVLKDFDSDAHEILEGIQIVFQNGQKLSKKKQKELIEAAIFVARGVAASDDESE